MVGKRRSRVVFGSDWAGTGKIDNNEKIETKRKIRERINAVLRTEAKKLVSNQPNARTNSRPNRRKSESKIFPLRETSEARVESLSA